MTLSNKVVVLTYTIWYYITFISTSWCFHSNSLFAMSRERFYKLISCCTRKSVAFPLRPFTSTAVTLPLPH